jgi:hypothetical protein
MHSRNSRTKTNEARRCAGPTPASSRAATGILGRIFDFDCANLRFIDLPLPPSLRLAWPPLARAPALGRASVKSLALAKLHSARCATLQKPDVACKKKKKTKNKKQKKEKKTWIIDEPYLPLPSATSQALKYVIRQ